MNAHMLRLKSVLGWRAFLRELCNSASINKDDADDRDINTKPIIH